MKSFIRDGDKDTGLFPHQSSYGYLIVDENGGIIACNKAALELAQLCTEQVLKPELLIKERLDDLIGPDFKETLLGSCITGKKSLHGQYKIGAQLYQVIIDRVKEDGKVWYEAFYFPVKEDDSSKGKESTVFQELAYDTAVQKGYTDVHWIKNLTNVHARQIVYCLTNHEHTTIPNNYCPFRHECGFNEVHGWQHLARRSFHRTEIGVPGRLYLTHINNQPVPYQMTKRRIDCIIEDLSFGGAKLLSPLNVPENSTFSLLFDEMILSCNMRWKQEAGDHWIFGVEFDKLSKEERNRIVNITIQYQVRFGRNK